MADTMKYDVGLGHIGEGADKIFSYLSQQALKQKRVDAIGKITSGVPRDDDLVSQYLDAAVKYADIDHKVSEEFVQSAMDRAGEVYDANVAHQRKDPIRYQKLFTPKGEIDVSKVVKNIHKEEKRKEKMVKFLMGVEHDDLEGWEKNYLDAAKEQALLEESGDEYVDAVKYMIIKRGQEHRFNVGEKGKNARAYKNRAENLYKSRLTQLGKEQSILYGQITKVKSSIAKKEEQLAITPGDTGRASINADITSSKQELDAIYEKIAAKAEEKLQTYGKMEIDDLEFDHERRDVVKAFVQLRKKYGTQDAARRLDIALRQKKGKSLSFYGIPIIAEKAEEIFPKETQ
jgi:hypothetical protein